MRLPTVLLLCVGITLGGCHVSTSERFVMSDRRAVTRKARLDGDYRLYRVGSETERALVLSRRLLKGQLFGFRLDGTRRTAVAGADESPLESGRYEWRLAPDEGQFDPLLTFAFLGITAALLTAIGFAAYDAGFDFD